MDFEPKVLTNIDQWWTNLTQKVWNNPKTLKKLCKIERIFKQIFNQILFSGILLWPNRFWNNRQICDVDGQALKESLDDTCSSLDHCVRPLTRGLVDILTRLVCISVQNKECYLEKIQSCFIPCFMLALLKCQVLHARNRKLPRKYL